MNGYQGNETIHSQNLSNYKEHTCVEIKQSFFTGIHAKSMCIPISHSKPIKNREY